MVSEDIFLNDRLRSPDTLFGDWTRILQVTASEGQDTVPEWIQDTTSANPVYRRVDSLVPDAVRDCLWTWRGRYISGDTTGRRP